MAVAGTQLERTNAAPQTLGNGASSVALLWNRARGSWSAMPPAQRRWSTIVVLCVAALLSFLIWNATRTDWRTLQAGLEPEDAQQIGQLLTQAQIPYDIAANGTVIRVSAQQIDKARLALAAKGGVKSGRMGFELFDKPNWVGSEFDEQVNYQRALEGELEHTIATLADIESARVHLALPHESLFRTEERPAKASVVLRLRHASLAEGEPDAIRNLVASAVDGLAPDHVVLVDASGRIPLGPKTAEMLRLSAEQALEDKIVSTLEPVTGAGNVRASVTLDYDEAATDETEETYDPDQTATLSMQRTEQTTGDQPVAAGVPGTTSNAPNAQPLPVYPRMRTAPETSKTESGTYGVSKSVRHTVLVPGRVHRMTAAIVVNDRLVHAPVKGSPAQWQNWAPDALRNLTLLAQAAVGFDASRGDVLTVQDLAFDANRPQPEPSLPNRIASSIENSPLVLKYLSILAGVVAVLALGVRPLLRMASVSASVAVKQLPGSTQLPQALEEPVQLDPELARTQALFERVASRLKQEPAQSSRLIQSWIHSE